MAGGRDHLWGVEEGEDTRADEAQGAGTGLQPQHLQCRAVRIFPQLASVVTLLILNGLQRSKMISNKGGCTKIPCPEPSHHM